MGIPVRPKVKIVGVSKKRTCIRDQVVRRRLPSQFRWLVTRLAVGSSRRGRCSNSDGIATERSGMSDNLTRTKRLRLAAELDFNGNPRLFFIISTWLLQCPYIPARSRRRGR